MKYSLMIVSAFLVNCAIQAQAFTCSNAARYDAGYTKAMQLLENVSITLQQSKPLKNADVKNRAEQSSSSSNSFYAVTGITSTAQFSSVEANIGFSTCSKIPVFELYKAEIISGMRAFAIPAGSNGSHSVNIPIQAITPPALQNPNNGGAVVWGKGSFKINFPNGYLSPGEYILIDKNSISPDGTQMKGVAFTIK